MCKLHEINLNWPVSRCFKKSNFVLLFYKNICPGRVRVCWVFSWILLQTFPTEDLRNSVHWSVHNSEMDQTLKSIDVGVNLQHCEQFFLEQGLDNMRTKLVKIIKTILSSVRKCVDETFCNQWEFYEKYENEFLKRG